MLSTDSPETKRRALMRVSLHCLGEFLQLPKDVTVLDINRSCDDSSRDTATLLLESDQFPIVREGEGLTEYVAEYKGALTSKGFELVEFGPLKHA